jgi:hypothetical protein
MISDRYGRAIVVAAALFLAFAAIEVLAMRDCGQVSRHVQASLRPGMTVTEVMHATRGWLAARADPESADDGRHGFTIYTYGLQRDDTDRREILGGFTKPDDLAARMEEEMKKRPGPWVLYFEYTTLERRWNTYFTVTIGPDLRVRQIGDVERKRSEAPRL